MSRQKKSRKILDILPERRVSRAELDNIAKERKRKNKKGLKAGNRQNVEQSQKQNIKIHATSKPKLDNKTPIDLTKYKRAEEFKDNAVTVTVNTFGNKNTAEFVVKGNNLVDVDKYTKEKLKAKKLSQKSNKVTSNSDPVNTNETARGTIVSSFGDADFLLRNTSKKVSDKASDNSRKYFDHGISAEEARKKNIKSNNKRSAEELLHDFEDLDDILSKLK